MEEHNNIICQESPQEHLDLQNDDEFYFWRRNCPYLYDSMLSYTLEWPTLTLDWLPNSYKSADGTYSVHKIIFGTHTNGEDQNHLIVAEVHLADSFEAEDLMCHESFAEYRYNNDTNISSSIQFEIKAKLNHPGEVNKALHMHQHPFIIATKTATKKGDTLLFDYSKHESFSSDDLVRPQLVLTGHNNEGYALSWNFSNEGFLISGGKDSRICFWDIANYTEGGIGSYCNTKSGIYNCEYYSNDNTGCTESIRSIEALNSYEWHKGEINDVQWHPSHAYVFASVSDDKFLALWDIREKSMNPSQYSESPNCNILNSISFNCFIPTVFATSDSGGKINIWDLRDLSHPIKNIKYHRPIAKIEWSPWCPNIIASACGDNRVVLWDICKESNQSDSTSSEIIFSHAGHGAPISDFSWNYSNHGDPLLIASASEDNTIQFWQISDIFL
ncbi:uncharacterized protein CMU_041170 [Cryptosporidium muris RN66]|uniref:Histone-binding protein RBBP4-like N-terminal domain-containing protein n=1 Tax=Cryptosporidium muris (strain RN66) TaxID=441375 RepID=B6AA06_CRYMR|nr:uncharacterized protein CMU_041170 [Cryptosporidium muris RN66]EEA05047.1 hypothetical protein, conserved [Cryptosporidium muris RN66]|eukprot:XP_002139396.1 hypothetical protein [Cryptosporidium muris RN66]